MFVAGKFLALLTQPLVWVMLLLAVSWVCMRQRPALARGLTGLALGAMLMMGWLPLPNAVLQPLESQYAEIPPQSDLAGYTGMVVLGGGLEQAYIAVDHSQPLLNEGGERMVAAVAAMRRHPSLRVIFTGGEGALFHHGPSEAQRARVFFDSLGVAADRVEYESASRTTYENAVLTAQLPRVDRTQRWLLVTSAWHMPRAMDTFTAAGWNVTAYPVDFRTGASTPWTAYSLNEGTRRWQLALHELVGSVAYRLIGRR